MGGAGDGIEEEGDGLLGEEIESFSRGGGVLALGRYQLMKYFSPPLSIHLILPPLPKNNKNTNKTKQSTYPLLSNPLSYSSIDMSKNGFRTNLPPTLYTAAASFAPPNLEAISSKAELTD